MNPLKEVSKFGQSVWLDFIRRGLITSGELRRLLEDDGVRGVTSNPAIFGKAIAGSTDYTDILDEMRDRGYGAMRMYETLAIRDIQDAADILKPVYQKANGNDGYVSFEVSPYMAYDTKSTIKEARRLWEAVGRENLMIKVPATEEGIPAIKELIGEGIKVNVTLIFSIEAYERVANAYITGLERLAERGDEVKGVASVASFFISRIDSAVDGELENLIKGESNKDRQSQIQRIMGKVAIANAKVAYYRFKEIFKGERWQKLEKIGAQKQRLLWASTGTKNPKYSDVLYVEELIGFNTVNTMPPSTLDAFRDHGNVRNSIEENVDAAFKTIESLEKLGVSLNDVTNTLLKDGVQLFSDAFDELLKAIDSTCKGGTTAKINLMSHSLDEQLLSEVRRTIDDWQKNNKVRSLWKGDSSLWTGKDEGNWVGWLSITEDQLAHSNHLQDIKVDVKREGFTHALLLGMGGSSLCPETLKMTFGKIEGYPELYILDSTDPAQIGTFEQKVDLTHTIFIVSSKSGSTLEPNVFTKYFMDRVKQALKTDSVGDRFIAITDPGSKLEQLAKKENFRHIFHGLPSIGGRYSALSNFGMVPASIMGMDTLKFLDKADEMSVACSSCLPAWENPGVILGVILGVLANNGKDKVTVIASPGIWDFGAWLEQLLAESTGKIGKGIIPVDREKAGPQDVYGQDRLFIYVRLDSAPDAQQDEALELLEKSDQPVVRISVTDPYDLGQEFFRWEMATAVAGSIIGINPFNQPDVEASKVVTRELTAEYEKTGSLPPEIPVLEDEGVKLFTDKKNASWLTEKAEDDNTLSGYLRAHLNRCNAGDYCALLGYIEMNEENEEKLQTIRHLIRDKKKVATCLGFGPRFLHSTGQAYKGGPNTGVFLQVTCDDHSDLNVPGQKYTFGIIKSAQARGDFAVLSERNRRLLRIHLGSDVKSGLTTLLSAIEKSLA